MFDHLVISINDHHRSLAFYTQALAPLGIEVEDTWSNSFSMMIPGRPAQLGFSAVNTDVTPQHIAFSASSEDQVRQFHAQAIAAGGTDNGAPGLREKYDSGYFAAFVIDPDGHNLEAVYHVPG
ncbi:MULTISPECIES: VOC family protein [unclassified Pseudomonas]|uniref:VOC family protein n=1 Tax=unclassified Pseudomonas TaxID=196821 RepID=UPI0015A2C7BF|nr:MULTISPECIES: VOC family protein [unclassified Pseudomonas]NWC95737.1 VOC family protein [Pseudomonas sp. IPO3779]NWD15347.1 VOC family protein [Pseudomonas sp. IPO3778]